MQFSMGTGEPKPICFFVDVFRIVIGADQTTAQEQKSSIGEIAWSH